MQCRERAALFPVAVSKRHTCRLGRAKAVWLAAPGAGVPESLSSVSPSGQGPCNHDLARASHGSKNGCV